MHTTSNKTWWTKQAKGLLHRIDLGGIMFCIFEVSSSTHTLFALILLHTSPCVSHFLSYVSGTSWLFVCLEQERQRARLRCQAPDWKLPVDILNVDHVLSSLIMRLQTGLAGGSFQHADSGPRGMHGPTVLKLLCVTPSAISTLPITNVVLFEFSWLLQMCITCLLWFYSKWWIATIGTGWSTLKVTNDRVTFFNTMTYKRIS